MVTGAAGFVGANLVRRLLADGHRVEAAVAPGSDTWRLESLRGELAPREADLRDADATDDLVAGTAPDWIFHLAAHGAYSSQSDAARIHATIIDGTANLLRAALGTGFEAFVNSGSSSEYGFKDHPPSEDEVLEPNSDYAVAKAAASLHCAFNARQHDVQAVTLRLYSIYGPWEEPTRFIPTLLSRGLRGELPPLVSPAVARDFVYVDDAIDAYLLAAAADSVPRGSIFNVATGVQTSIGDAVEAARRLLGIEAEPEWDSMQRRSWDTDVWVGDGSRARDRLGWEPRHDLEAGLARTAEWLRGEPGVRDRYELAEK